MKTNNNGIKNIIDSPILSLNSNNISFFIEAINLTNIGWLPTIERVTFWKLSGKAIANIAMAKIVNNYFEYVTGDVITFGGDKNKIANNGAYLCSTFIANPALSHSNTITGNLIDNCDRSKPCKINKSLTRDQAITIMGHGLKGKNPDEIPITTRFNVREKLTLTSDGINTMNILHEFG